MTYPAFYEMVEDAAIIRSPTAIRVYLRLNRIPLIFFEPQYVKAWGLAKEMGVEPETVNNALKLLMDLGYIVEHSRGANNVRRVMLVRERQQKAG